MFGFQIGPCRTCHKLFIWYPWDRILLKVFDVCSDECLANCEEAQQYLHLTDGGLSAPDNESQPATIGG